MSCDNKGRVCCPPGCPVWQISVRTPAEAEVAMAALLESLFGEPPAVYVDVETQTIALSIYCQELPRPEAEIRFRLRTSLRRIREDGLKMRVAIRKIRRQDWAESWKKHFRPLEFGQALLVKPSWSQCKPRAGQGVVVLDPGLSFGTGQHPTTAFCLEQLVACRQKGQTQSLLDIGTGTGILAIAAAKLGYRPIQAIDLDPAAVRVAKANALQNRVAKRVRILQCDVTRLPIGSETKFDVICANLIYDLLIGQTKRILSRLQPRGTFISAGILKTQFDQVRVAYAAAGLELIVTRKEKEWQSGAFAFAR